MSLVERPRLCLWLFMQQKQEVKKYSEQRKWNFGTCHQLEKVRHKWTKTFPSSYFCVISEAGKETIHHGHQIKRLFSSFYNIPALQWTCNLPSKFQMPSTALRDRNNAMPSVQIQGPATPMLRLSSKEKSG